MLTLATAWQVANEALPRAQNPVWQLAYRVYPKIEEILTRFGLHAKRQRFLIGKLRETSTDKIGEFKLYLKSHGFEEAVIAWRDPGQVFSLRKLEGRDYQFHIRVFADGEVRTHRELAAEAHPLGHVLEAGLVPGEDYFLPIIQDFVTPSIAPSAKQ